MELETFTNSSISIIFQYIYVGSLLFFLLLTSMSLCMYILAIHHHQFTSWVADLIFLIVCLVLSQLTVITLLVIAISSLPYLSPVVLSIQVIYFILISLATVGFTALTLVPMCCRACGYNLCMRSVATRESHRQALREILPLFILLSPSVGALVYKQEI